MAVRVIYLSSEEKVVNKSHNIGHCEPAEAIISSKAQSDPENMTPKNRVIFGEHVK